MRILTHNAYWFQGHPSRWGIEQVAEVPEVVRALTELYASAGPDLVCLQEVHRGDLAETLARALDMTVWLHTPGGLRAEYGGALLSRRQSRLRNGTSPVGATPHERVHLRAAFEWSGMPVELAAVHLPSNRFADSSEAGDAARVAELERVLAEPPRPHIIAGDLNCRPHSPPYRFLQKAGYLDAAALADSDTVSKRRVDYFWLDQTWAGRLVAFSALDGSAFCRTAPDGTAWRLSDHLPLLMEVE